MSDGYNYYTLPNVHAAVVAYYNWYSTGVRDARDRLNGVKLLVPVIADRECDAFRVRGGEKGFAHGATGEKSAGKVFYPTPVCRCACRSQRESSPPPHPPVLCSVAPSPGGRTLSAYVRAHPLAGISPALSVTAAHI